MLFSLWNGDPRETLISLLLTIPVVLFALCAHEAAHGFAAWKCGDMTARNLGRLTLNPLKHLDPLGVLCMLVFGYGWAKPVPINARNFTNPRRGMALTAAAGPATNLLLGIFNAALCGLARGWYASFADPATGVIPATSATTALFYLYELFWYGAVINFVFAFFNLIPIPPFDGSRIALAFLPDRVYFGLMKYERQILAGLLIVFVVLSRFGASPFSLLANWLTEQISAPIAALFRTLISA